jgi:hypothetical protein
LFLLKNQYLEMITCTWQGHQILTLQGKLN